VKDPKAPKDPVFAERIQMVLDLRGWSLNKLGDQAGIGSGPMSRLRQRGPADATVATLAKVADAAGVELRWLALGAGPMLASNPVPVDAESRRALAARLAEEADVPEAVIREALRHPIQPDEKDRPVLWWADRLRLAALEHLGLANPLSAPAASGKRPKKRST